MPKIIRIEIVCPECAHKFEIDIPRKKLKRALKGIFDKKPSESERPFNKGAE